MLNRVIIQGRLTATPELKYTANGKAVTAVNVAVERDKADANGQKQTDFITCVIWGGLAEFVGKWFAKGQMITVEGRMQGRIWQDKDGNNRKTWEIVANAAYFCGNAPEEKPKQSGREPTYNIGDFEPLSDSDDVPF